MRTGCYVAGLMLWTFACASPAEAWKRIDKSDRAAVRAFQKSQTIREVWLQDAVNEALDQLDWNDVIKKPSRAVYLKYAQGARTERFRQMGSEAAERLEWEELDKEDISSLTAFSKRAQTGPFKSLARERLSRLHRKSLVAGIRRESILDLSGSELGHAASESEFAFAYYNELENPQLGLAYRIRFPGNQFALEKAKKLWLGLRSYKYIVLPLIVRKDAYHFPTASFPLEISGWPSARFVPRFGFAFPQAAAERFAEERSPMYALGVVEILQVETQPISRSDCRTLDECFYGYDAEGLPIYFIRYGGSPPDPPLECEIKLRQCFAQKGLPRQVTAKTLVLRGHRYLIHWLNSDFFIGP